MKVIRCPDCHSKMQRMYARHSVGKINNWNITKYFYCPKCDKVHSDGETKTEEMRTAVVDTYGKASISRTLKGQVIEYRVKK